jgi:hypothetical protein
MTDPQFRHLRCCAGHGALVAFRAGLCIVVLLSKPVGASGKRVAAEIKATLRATAATKILMGFSSSSGFGPGLGSKYQFARPRQGSKIKGSRSLASAMAGWRTLRPGLTSRVLDYLQQKASDPRIKNIIDTMYEHMLVCKNPELLISPRLRSDGKLLINALSLTTPAIARVFSLA